MKKTNKKVVMTNDRDFLIEQCMRDAYCERTGEQLDEGWWDDMKAGAAGMWSGAKQGLKNMGTRAKNIAGNAKKTVQNAGTLIGAAGAGLKGDKSGMFKAANKVGKNKWNDINDGVTMPASFAKNFAKFQSYSKSATDVLNQLLNVVETMVGDEVRTGAGLGPDIQNLINTLTEFASASPEEAWDSLNPAQ